MDSTHTQPPHEPPMEHPKKPEVLSSLSETQDQSLVRIFSKGTIAVPLELSRQLGFLRAAMPEIGMPFLEAEAGRRTFESALCQAIVNLCTRHVFKTDR